LKKDFSFGKVAYEDNQGTCDDRGSTTTRKTGGLDFAAKDGKRQGHEVPWSLKTTR